MILCLFEGAEKKWEGAAPFELLRAGEDVWDRFAIIHQAGLSDEEIKREAEGLPQLSPAERATLVNRFGIAPEGLRGKNAEAESLLRKYDRWQGTSWEKRYADEMAAREWGGEADSLRTTLFSLFERGFYYPVASPGIYTWRDYGDIPWACDKSNLHYDWLRAALKHYLKTGHEEALRWGLSAMRHAVSVDHLWENQRQPARTDYLNLAGFSRYEKGNHGGSDFIARQTHSWVEGLFLAHAISGDPWVGEAAIDLAEADWRVWEGERPASWDGGYGETRMVTWPLLVQVVAFQETGNLKYWKKAKELMAVLLQNEQRSGGKGYVTNPLVGIGNENNAYTLMNSYSVKGLVAFAEEALRRGEWTADYSNLMKRWATWLTTPVPHGAYFPDGNYFTPPNPAVEYGTFVYAFCPPGLKCTLPTSPTGDVVYNMMISDLFTWLAKNDPGGANPNTKQTWDELARLTFHDSVNHGPQPYGVVGFLTNMYPTTETKALGWIQLFQDRTALYLADSSPSPSPESCTYSLSPSGQNFGAEGGSGTIYVTAPAGCAFSAASHASWITFAPLVAAPPKTSSGVVNFSVAANSGTNSRTGTLTIAGLTFTVSQQGQPCTYSISPARTSFPSPGGTGSVLVSAPAGCDWTAASAASWISVTSGSSGSGNDQVHYSASANLSPSPRSGTVSIAGKTFRVDQEGQPCSYALSPTGKSFSFSEATGSVGVAAAAGCPWTARSQVP